MGNSEHTEGASLIAASLSVTNRAEYAVSFSAIKFCEDEGVDVVSGVHLILSTDDESARQRAMQIATDKYKPADGYVGHVVAAVKIFGVAEETTPTSDLSITYTRVCDNCGDDSGEAVPLHGEYGNGKHYNYLCVDCFNLLGLTFGNE